MLRRIPIKAWIGIGAGVVAVITAVIVAIMINNQPDAYRIIKVYEIVGNAQVMRGKGKVIDVYNSMRLESDDKVITGKESYLQLKLDDDKYVLLEPETEISIKAVGTEQDSKTRIYLKKGAIVNCIEEELSDSSEYKIETPNSTIAVRGTKFRVKLEMNKKGETYTLVSVYEGSVKSRLVYPDGSIAEEEVEIISNKSAKILGTDDNSMYIVESEDVNYKELDLEVLEFLKKSVETGKKISISEEELQEIIDSIKANEKSTENIQETSEKPSEETSPEVSEDVSENVTEESGEDVNESTEETTEGLTEENIEASTEEETTTEEPETEETTTEEITTEESETEEATTEEPETEETTTEAIVKYYTVTFKYAGKIFAKQKVKEGDIPTRPTMKPARQGDWDYDFKTTVSDDIVVNWVQ